MQDYSEYHLGTTNVPVQLEHVDQHRLATQHMVQQCHRTIHIISRDLDPAVYDLPEFCSALTQVLLEHRRMKVRILVHDGQTIVRNGHKLLAVAQRLSSFVEIRKPGPDHKDFNGGMFIGDGVGFITRRTSDRYVGQMNFNDRREARTLLDEFDEMWAKSTLDPNLRRFVV